MRSRTKFRVELTNSLDGPKRKAPTLSESVIGMSRADLGREWGATHPRRYSNNGTTVSEYLGPVRL